MKASILKSPPLRDATLLIYLRFEDCHFNVDTFKEDRYFTTAIFEDGYFNDGIAEGCYFTVDNSEDCLFNHDQGAVASKV